MRRCRGVAHIAALVDYVRGHMPGFERCYVVDVAPQTGVRQTRLLDGEYVVDKEDLAQRTRFADTVARGRDYTTPYRAMLPRSVDNLLVAGRHYSATPAAQKISREIPPCMAMGEAAGVAAALALDAGVRVRDVDVAAAATHAARPRRRPGRRARAERRRAGHRAGRQPAGAHRMNADRPNDLPLAGIRVIDFTQVMLGPVCTQMLADYGADVIKIERKGAGDLSRSTFEPVAGHDNPVFCSLNRNKRSAALDLKDPGAPGRRACADRRTPTSSSTTSAPASWSAWGSATRNAGALNPRIIYAVGTGFGETGPYAHKGGQDVLAQAMSGVDGAQGRRRAPAVDLRDDLRRLFGRHAPRAGDPARASCSASARARARRSASRCTTRCSPRRCRRRR